MRLLMLVGLVLGITAPACGGAPTRSKTLVSEVRGYNEGLRWRKHEQAAVRVPPAERDAFVDERVELDEELRISEYEITRLSFVDSERSRAHVRVRWTWHLDRKGIVHTTITAQDWRRHGKRWLLIDERRVSGDEMPGMAEPPPPEPPAEPEAGPSSSSGTSPAAPDTEKNRAAARVFASPGAR